MKNKREHNFRVVHNHPKATPGKLVWRCDDCDTEILLPFGLDQAGVNREMANKMLCIIPEPGQKKKSPFLN
jgi:hypothetical protein